MTNVSTKVSDGWPKSTNTNLRMGCADWFYVSCLPADVQAEFMRLTFADAIRREFLGER